MDSGKVFLDGVPTADPGRAVDDLARIRLTSNAPRLQPGRDLIILHRDPGFVVIWKPSGLLSVPAPREGGQRNALATVRRICGSGLAVHRLDEATSGLMLVALNEAMQLALKDLLQEHQIDRGYLALVAQPFPHQAWSIQSELVRDRGDGLRGSLIVPAAPGKSARTRRLHPPPDQDTRRAITHVALLENLERDASVVSVRLETGRTHQVRIHLAEIGHPVLGDPLYAKPRIHARAPRLALHACRLAFTHPLTGQPVEITAPLADDLEQLRRRLSIRDDPDQRAADRATRRRRTRPKK